jgi:hypothetical protein
MIKWLLCLTVIVVLGATVCVHAQSAGDYRSAVPAFVYDAEWTDVSNWEIYRTVGGWQAATGADGYPGQNASPNTVTIRQHLSIFIYRAIHINQTPNNSIQNVVVNSGGRLLTAGNPNFTISQMLTVSSGGIMTYAGTGSLTVTGATTIAGEFEDSEGSGTTRFIGLVTNSRWHH